MMIVLRQNVKDQLENRWDIGLNYTYLSSKYFIFECEQVHWVQCDKCELWYHLFCIGLKPQDIKEDEDFNCKFCKVGSGSKRNNDTSASDMDTE